MTPRPPVVQFVVTACAVLDRSRSGPVRCRGPGAASRLSIVVAEPPERRARGAQLPAGRGRQGGPRVQRASRPPRRRPRAASSSGLLQVARRSSAARRRRCRGRRGSRRGGRRPARRSAQSRTRRWMLATRRTRASSACPSSGLGEAVALGQAVGAALEGVDVGALVQLRRSAATGSWVVGPEQAASAGGQEHGQEREWAAQAPPTVRAPAAALRAGLGGGRGGDRAGRGARRRRQRGGDDHEHEGEALHDDAEAWSPAAGRRRR